jgi:hypothetical protein
VRWVLLDVALVLLTLVVLAVAGLGLYRAVRRLLREVGDAGTRVGEVSAGLALDPPPSARRPAA